MDGTHETSSDGPAATQAVGTTPTCEFVPLTKEDDPRVGGVPEFRVLPIKELKRHELLRTAVPPDPLSREALHESVFKTGVKSPVFAVPRKTPDGSVVLLLTDGNQRTEEQEASGRTEIPCLIRWDEAERTFEELIEDAILSQAVARRNLDVPGIIRVGMTLEKILEAKPCPEGRHGKLRDYVASRLGRFSGVTYEKGRKILEALDAGAFPLGQLFEDGLLRVDSAYNLFKVLTAFDPEHRAYTAKLDPERQQEVVDEAHDLPGNMKDSERRTAVRQMVKRLVPDDHQETASVVDDESESHAAPDASAVRPDEHHESGNDSTETEAVVTEVVPPDSDDAEEKTQQDEAAPPGTSGATPTVPEGQGNVAAEDQEPDSSKGATLAADLKSFDALLDKNRNISEEIRNSPDDFLSVTPEALRKEVRSTIIEAVSSFQNLYAKLLRLG